MLYREIFVFWSLPLFFVLSRHCGKKAHSFFTNGEPTATDYKKAPDKGFFIIDLRLG